MSDLTQKYFNLLENYNHFKSQLFTEDEIFSPIKEPSLFSEMGESQIQRAYEKLKVEYHKLRVTVALSEFYLQLAKTNSYPLPSYPDISELAMKTVELVDKNNISRALPGELYRDLALLD